MNVARPRIVFRTLTLVAMLGLLLTPSCGGYSGPPDLESAKIGLPAEYHITYDGAEGRTVLDLLEENATSIETSGYSDEFLVVSINGLANGTDGRYWFYYVNGEPGQTAANRHETAVVDRIEWLFTE